MQDLANPPTKTERGPWSGFTSLVRDISGVGETAEDVTKFGVPIAFAESLLFVILLVKTCLYFLVVVCYKVGDNEANIKDPRLHSETTKPDIPAILDYKKKTSVHYGYRAQARRRARCGQRHVHNRQSTV